MDGRALPLPGALGQEVSIRALLKTVYAL
jgi:hypothetical protein